MSKIKFPKKLREDWLKALRSGRYRQTYGLLEDDGSYCCLGVCARKLNIPIRDISNVGNFTEIKNKEKHKQLIPKALLKDGENTKFCNDLISMNDDDGKNFKEIADYIEKKTIGV